MEKANGGDSCGFVDHNGFHLPASAVLSGEWNGKSRPSSSLLGLRPYSQISKASAKRIFLAASSPYHSPASLRNRSATARDRAAWVLRTSWTRFFRASGDLGIRPS